MKRAVVVDDDRPAPSAGSDARLVEIEALFRSEWRALVRLAYLLVDDVGLAEQVVQEAFLRAYRSWTGLRDVTAGPAYLRSAVLNLARSELRHRRVVRERAPLQPVEGLRPDEQVVLGEDRRAVIDAVRALRGRQRECVVLRYFVGLSEAETATELGISVGTVKSHTHRALAAIESSLEDQR